MAKQPFNPLLAAKARDKRNEQASATSPKPTGQRDASGHFTRSTPNHSKKNSPDLSVTSHTISTPAPTPQKQKDSLVPAPGTGTPQRTQQRNINDPSYREQRGPMEPQGNRIADQMTQAKNDPTYPEKKQKNIEQRKQARDEFAKKPRNGMNPLRTQQESGTISTFQRASQIQHRRNDQGRETNQEMGRPQRMALNPRPGQRVHPTK